MSDPDDKHEDGDGDKATPTERPPVPKDPSTLGYVADVQREPDPENPSWSNLTEKVMAFVRRRYRGHRLPAAHSLDDLSACVLQRVHRDIARYEQREGSTFWGWVRRICDNTLTDLWRRETADKRLPPDIVQSAATDSQPGGNLPDPAALTASVLARANEVQDAMLDCLSRMVEETATVLRLRLLEHQSYEEILPVIGRNRTVTVRSIYMRGRSKLERCMRDKGFGDMMAHP